MSDNQWPLLGPCDIDGSSATWEKKLVPEDVILLLWVSCWHQGHSTGGAAAGQGRAGAQEPGSGLCVAAAADRTLFPH